MKIPAVLLILLLAPSPVFAGGDQVSEVPPLLVPGSRAVDVRNSSGGLARYTTIPSGSLFATHGGSGQPCEFTAQVPGLTSTGEPYEAGQVVRSYHWLFVEGLLPTFEQPTPDDPTASKGPLGHAVRHFVVFCDTTNHAIGVVDVYPNDPMLDPHSQLTRLYNGLQLEQPVVYRNPVVDRWGGLITRFPAWLAIQPSAWRPQGSNVVTWRGWSLSLLTEPLSLEFLVDFTPDPAQPSAPFQGVVPCVAAGGVATADAASFPAMPSLPAQTRPGVNGPCEWTPPGPGTVTIQARIAYHVTFWANGYTEAQPDYVWTSGPATFETGELAAVNTNH